jgi:hypothetical protein
MLSGPFSVCRRISSVLRYRSNPMNDKLIRGHDGLEEFTGGAITRHHVCGVRA